LAGWRAARDSGLSTARKAGGLRLATIRTAGCARFLMLRHAMTTATASFRLLGSSDRRSWAMPTSNRQPSTSARRSARRRSGAPPTSPRRPSSAIPVQRGYLPRQRVIRLCDLHRRSGLRGSGFQEPRIVRRSGLQGHHLVQSGEVSGIRLVPGRNVCLRNRLHQDDFQWTRRLVPGDR